MMSCTVTNLNKLATDNRIKLYSVGINFHGILDAIASYNSIHLNRNRILFPFIKNNE